MKVTVNEVVGFWNALNAIYEANDTLPGQFDYHQKRNLRQIRAEVEVLQEMDPKERLKIGTEELELNLSKITPEQLPPNMPKGTLELIRPLILEPEEKQPVSALQALLKKKEKPEKKGKK